MQEENKVQKYLKQIGSYLAEHQLLIHAIISTAAFIGIYYCNNGINSDAWFNIFCGMVATEIITFAISLFILRKESYKKLLSLPEQIDSLRTQTNEISNYINKVGTLNLVENGGEAGLRSVFMERDDQFAFVLKELINSDPKEIDLLGFSLEWLDDKGLLETIIQKAMDRKSKVRLLLCSPSRGERDETYLTTIAEELGVDEDQEESLVKNWKAKYEQQLTHIRHLAYSKPKTNKKKKKSVRKRNQDQPKTPTPLKLPNTITIRAYTRHQHFISLYRIDDNLFFCPRTFGKRSRKSPVFHFQSRGLYDQYLEMFENWWNSENVHEISELSDEVHLDVD